MLTFFTALGLTGAAATLGMCIVELRRESHPAWIISAILSFTLVVVNIANLLKASP